MSPTAKERLLGLNPPLTPDGNAPTARFAVYAVFVPAARLTATVYVALPAVPNVSVPTCPPTVTEPICGAKNVAVAAKSLFPFAEAAHVVVPVHPPLPLHPAKLKPVPGVAVRFAL